MRGVAGRRAPCPSVIETFGCEALVPAQPLGASAPPDRGRWLSACRRRSQPLSPTASPQSILRYEPGACPPSGEPVTPHFPASPHMPPNTASHGAPAPAGTRLTCSPTAAGSCRALTRPGGSCSSAAVPPYSGCASRVPGPSRKSSGRHLGPWAVGRLVRQMGRGRHRAGHPAFRCLKDRDDITGRLGEINSPALIVHGSADAAISLAKAQELRDGLAGPARLAVIEGCTHASNMSHPAEVSAKMLTFLRELDGPEQPRPDLPRHVSSFRSPRHAPNPLTPAVLADPNAGIRCGPPDDRDCPATGAHQSCVSGTV